MIGAINSYNGRKYSVAKSKQIHFMGYTREAMKEMRRLNNIPEIVNAAYDGFTGAKKVNFPTKINLDISSYPDITQDLEKFKDEVVSDIQKINKKFLKKINIYKLFLKNGGTGDPWDTKFLPQFPGRDINGKTQYAIYKDKIVSANYISNNLYGQLCAAAGIKQKFAQFIGKIYSCGLLEPFVNGKFPNKQLIKFRDPKHDQEAILSGFFDFLKHNPWEIKVDPSRPHPAF